MLKLFLRGEVSTPGVARGEKLRTLLGDGIYIQIPEGGYQAEASKTRPFSKRLELVLNPEPEPNSHFAYYRPSVVRGTGVMRLKRHHLA